MKSFPLQLTHSSGAPMYLDTGRLLLSFQAKVKREDLERILKELDMLLEDGDSEKSDLGERVNHTDRRFWVRSGKRIDDDRYQQIEKTAAKLGLDWIGPVYRLAGDETRRGLLAPIPNVVVLKLRDQRMRDSDGPSFVGITRAIAMDGAAPELREELEKSKYLNGYRYFVIKNPREVNSYQVKQRLLESESKVVADVQFETMPLIVPTAASPNDTLYAQQWNMTRIQAGGPGTTGWDISTGAATVVVCVLDSGCDLAHPDLQYFGSGIDLGSMGPDGSPNGSDPKPAAHGTACAGIIAATFNNALGVAGVAGNSRIMPVAFQNWSDAEVAAGITWATANGARIISMSFGSNAWSRAVIDPAIQHAFNNDVVMCVATHNFSGPITYPATNPLVIAVGASDQSDNRASFSDFGPEISVVAPGVNIPTTDRQGAAGYNTSAGVVGDYTMTFGGTSAATPHVAGLAALIRSTYPTLTSVQVRAIIERTAEKVGMIAYADVPGLSNGTWNQEMGYGRINVFRALDHADVMIKDAPGDTGVEPFTGGNFWDFSDIAVRITDDGVFAPNNPSQSKNVERGQANYIYVRVTNNGPRDARNVVVNLRITPYVGLQFVYPQDWTLVDGMHVVPTPVTASFGSIPAGAAVMAKFRIEAAQTDVLYGWENGTSWHPCLLAQVTADNDYAYASSNLLGGNVVVRKNNFAQRNLSVIDVLAGAGASFPFVAGSLFDTDEVMFIAIDRSRLPKSMPLLLALDDDGSAFPLIDFEASLLDGNQSKNSCQDHTLVFLDRARVKTKLGCNPGVLTLEKGSRFDCLKVRSVGAVTVDGGEVILRGDKRYVEVKESMLTVKIEKSPNGIYPMSLRTTLPARAERGEQFIIQVAQQNTRGATVGGAAMVYVVK